MPWIRQQSLLQPAQRRNLSPCPPNVCYFHPRSVLRLVLIQLHPRHRRFMVPMTPSLHLRVTPLAALPHSAPAGAAHRWEAPRTPSPPARTPCRSRSHCSCPRCSSYTQEPKHDLEHPFPDLHACCNPDHICSTCSLHADVLHSCSTPPKTEGGKDTLGTCWLCIGIIPTWSEIPGSSPSPAWDPLPPGWRDIMHHQPLPAKGWWVTARSSCKVKRNDTVMFMACEGREKSPLLPYPLLSESWGQPAWSRWSLGVPLVWGSS